MDALGSAAVDPPFWSELTLTYLEGNTVSSQETTVLERPCDGEEGPSLEG